ncbi:MAG: hypothetical protein JWN46_2607 [Acidimicrobiales bacterium]|nr:hypothetical protein [Acidimicrobiales bacterium]
MRTQRLWKTTAAAALALFSTVAMAPTQGTTAPACRTPWGTMPKARPGMGRGLIVAQRGSPTRCYDRLIVQLSSQRGAGYDARYVARLTQEGTGRTIAVRGRAIVRLTILAPARAGIGVIGTDLFPVRGFQTFREVTYAGTSRGRSTYGIGVPRGLPFRVLVMRGPAGTSLIVLDVAHQ